MNRRKLKVLQQLISNVGFISFMIGLSGIAGAIEFGTGLKKSAFLFIMGIIFLAVSSARS